MKKIIKLSLCLITLLILDQPAPVRAQEPKQNSFFSVYVNPINNLKEGKQKGNFKADQANCCKIALTPTTGSKTVYFIPVNEVVEKGKEKEFLAKFGKKPLSHTTNYFFGTMAHPKCQESSLPIELKGKDIVAVSLDKSGVFLSSLGGQDFLGCYRGGNLVRCLTFIPITMDGWGPKDNWVFLAEDL